MLNTTRKPHVCDYLTTVADAHPDLPLFTCASSLGARPTTAAEACYRVAALSRAFTQKLGLLPGDRVCVLAHTTPYLLEALLAVTAAGCIAVPLNWRWTSSEALFGANLVGARVVIADDACMPVAKAIAEGCSTIRFPPIALRSVFASWQSDDERTSSYEPHRSPHANGNGSRAGVDIEEALNAAKPGKRVPLEPKAGPQDAAFVIFTSGTSGPPRGALLSHAALHFQCLAKLARCGYSSSDVYLHMAPLFHVGGLCSALAMLLAGARHVFLPVFSPSSAIHALWKYQCTCFIAVPTMVADLVGYASGATFRVLPNVRCVLIGAGGMPDSLLHAAVRLFPSATFLGAYGMTEACSSLTFLTLRSPHAAPNEAWKGRAPSFGGVCVGRPPPGIQIRILPLKDDVHSKPSLVASSSSSISSASSSVDRFLDTCTSQVEFLGDGKVGEVVTRGPHLMVRYWNDPRATRAAMDAAGTWFRTGDLGALIDSQLWLVGRAKDVVKTGGENVACAEVERVLLRHPAVAAAAVLGLPDARLGERVVAAVVLRDGWTWEGNHVHMLQGGSDARRSARGRQRAVDGGGAASQHESASSRRRKLVDGAELQMHCRQEGMAGFKLPRTIINMSALPLNATGKVVKARLKEQLAEMVVEAEGTNTGLQGAVRARL